MVREAWDSIPEEDLRELVKGMKDRCQAVIDTDGRQTQY